MLTTADNSESVSVTIECDGETTNPTTTIPISTYYQCAKILQSELLRIKDTLSNPQTSTELDEADISLPDGFFPVSFGLADDRRS